MCHLSRRRRDLVMGKGSVWLFVIPQWAFIKCLSDAIFRKKGSRVAARPCLIEGREPSVGKAMTGPRLQMLQGDQGQDRLVMPD